MVQEKTLESVYDLLTRTEIPSQLPAIMDNVKIEMVGYKLKNMILDKVCSAKDIFGPDERGVLVWYHRLKHCTFKTLLNLYKRLLITNLISKVRKTPLNGLPIC